MLTMEVQLGGGPLVELNVAINDRHLSIALRPHWFAPRIAHCFSKRRDRFWLNFTAGPVVGCYFNDDRED